LPPAVGAAVGSGGVAEHVGLGVLSEAEAEQEEAVGV